MATVTASHFTHATAAMSRTFTGPHFTNHRFPVTLPTDEIVAGLNAVQPDFLFAYPSALHVLSFEADAGRLRIAPRRVLSGGEPLLPEIRAAGEAAWGVRVGNWWGSSEGGGMGVACDHAGTHLSDDLVIVEPVDERGRPVGPEERSAKIYLTNLYNHALPLIRYEITDEVTVLDEPCACGSAMPRIEDIQGRLDDVFEYAEGRVHPHVFRSALGRHPAIVEYQVRQTCDGAHIAVRCQAAAQLDILRQQLEEALCGLGIARPQITIQTVERLNRPPGAAKLKRFVPLGLADPHHERARTAVAVCGL
jgi:phenylacetate-coenzyme A ligase PaaK-like adenylate-forming protein